MPTSGSAPGMPESDYSGPPSQKDLMRVASKVAERAADIPSLRMGTVNWGLALETGRRIHWQADSFLIGRIDVESHLGSHDDSRQSVLYLCYNPLRPWLRRRLV